MSNGLELKTKLADSKSAEDPQKAHHATGRIRGERSSGDGDGLDGASLDRVLPERPRTSSRTQPSRQPFGTAPTRASQAKRTTSTRPTSVSTAHSSCRPEAKSSVSPKKLPLPKTIRDCHHSLKLVGIASAAANLLWAYWGGVSTFSWCAQVCVRASLMPTTTTVPRIHHHALARARPGCRAQVSPAANTIGTMPATV